MRSPLLLAALLVLQTVCTSSSVKANSGASVTFFEGRPGTYLRSASYNTAEEHTFSNEEVSAAVAVLLGLTPPSSISQDSASKLNDLLSPNPFHRPRVVLMLTVKQIETGFKGEMFGNFPSQHRELAEKSETATLTIPEDVRLALLDTHLKEKAELSVLEQQLQAWSSLIGGSYQNKKGSLEGVLTVPLPNGEVLTLDLSKRTDQMVALELALLFQSIREAIAASEYGDKQWLGRLFFGTLTSAETLYKGSPGSINVEQASDLLVYTVSKIFNYMESVYSGGLVGVIVSANQGILDLKSTMGPSRLLLLETSSDNVTEAVAEVLTETIIAYFTGIMLIVALIIGTCLLVKMPLTRDTLLYSGAKLD